MDFLNLVLQVFNINIIALYFYFSSYYLPEFLNDVWIFDIYSGNWTWVGTSHTEHGEEVFPDHIGGSGVPSGRALSASWTSLDGDLFLFGGYGNFYSRSFSSKNYSILKIRIL